MNKSDLVNAISSESGLTRADAARALDATVGAITSALSKGDQVNIVGFGSFKTSKRSARAGRNPQTGESIQIAAATLPRFSPGKALKTAVNK